MNRHFEFFGRRVISGAAALFTAAFALLVSIAPAFAQDNTVITLPAPPASANSASGGAVSSLPAVVTSGLANGLMWEATKGGGSIFLVGSIHYASKAVYPLPQHIEDALAHSSTLVVELDPRHALDPSQGPYRSVGMYSGADSLWQHVRPRTHELLSKFCEQSGISEAILGRLKPWLVFVTILDIEWRAIGFESQNGLDRHFLDSAANKKVLEIETMDEQLRLVAQMPLQAIDDGLQAILEHPTDTMRLVQDLQSTWIRGDASAMDQLISSFASTLPSYHETMFTTRNRRMAATAEKCVTQKQQCFLVVGAGHFAGKDGILSLLEEHGFKVRQIRAQ